MTMRKSFSKWAIVFFALAVGFAGFNVWRWHDLSTSLDRMSSVSDEASIVEVRKHTSTEGSKGHKRKTTYYRPVVEFEDSDHIAHVAESLHESIKSSRYSKGEAVSVHYDPRDPESGVIIVGDEGATSSDGTARIVTAVFSLIVGTIPLIVDRAYAKQGMRGGTEPSASDADAQD